MSLLSRQSTRFKKAHRLRRRKGRDDSGLWLVEGVRVLEEALVHRTHLDTLFVTPDARVDARTAALIERAEATGTTIAQVDDAMLRDLCDARTPQGIVGVVRAPQRVLDLRHAVSPWVLVVDRIQDPGNLGTMLRTALAAGVDGIIVLGGTCDLGNPKVIRASAGAVFALAVASMEPSDLMRLLTSYGVALVAADVHGMVDLYEYDWTPPTALLVGNEAHGPDPSLLAHAKATIRIPMPGPAESLNAAVAAAICLYEGVRQRSRLSTQPR